MASEAFASDAKYLYVSIPALLLPNQNLNVANDETVTVVLHASDQFYNKRQAIWIAQLPGNETVCHRLSLLKTLFIVITIASRRCISRRWFVHIHRSFDRAIKSKQYLNWRESQRDKGMPFVQCLAC